MRTRILTIATAVVALACTPVYAEDVPVDLEMSNGHVEVVQPAPPAEAKKSFWARAKESVSSKWNSAFGDDEEPAAEPEVVEIELPEPLEPVAVILTDHEEDVDDDPPQSEPVDVSAIAEAHTKCNDIIRISGSLDSQVRSFNAARDCHLDVMYKHLKGSL